MSATNQNKASGYGAGFEDGVRAACALVESGALPSEILAVLPAREPVDRDGYQAHLAELRRILHTDLLVEVRQ